MAKGKGGMSVMVCELMRDLKIVTVKDGATVKDALELAEVKIDGEENLRVNGEEAKLVDKLSADDVITLVPHVAGGR
jgi:molybdopterin converting factor small subunit